MFATPLRWASRPATGALSAMRRADHELRAAVGSGMSRATLGLVDAALASTTADQAMERVLSSKLAERAVAFALSGALVDAVARDLARYEVIERVTEQILAGDTLDHAIDRAQHAGVPERVTERLLAGGIAEQTAARLVDGPELERIVALALDSPGMERAVDRVVASPVVEVAVARLVDDVLLRLQGSTALWTLIDDIAASPAVTDAITQQGAGFADQVAGRVRDGSRQADARLERAARRLLGRRAPSGTGPTASTTGAT